MLLFFWGSNRVAQVCLFCSHHFSDECFVNKAQFDAGFADCLILKVGAVPSYESFPVMSQRHRP